MLPQKIRNSTQPFHLLKKSNFLKNLVTVVNTKFPDIGINVTGVVILKIVLFVLFITFLSDYSLIVTISTKRSAEANFNLSKSKKINVKYTASENLPLSGPVDNYSSILI
jgi:hypothetical protein